MYVEYFLSSCYAYNWARGSLSLESYVHLIHINRKSLLSDFTEMHDISKVTQLQVRAFVGIIKALFSAKWLLPVSLNLGTST